jgi:hypothetical protein
MKIRLTIKRQVQLQPDLTEQKIENYLKNNFYRIIERGPGFITFKDDEFSVRKTSRSDIHSRIGEGKFEFYVKDQGTLVTLIYLTPILYPFLIIMAFVGAGLYMNTLGPIFMSLAFTIPIIYRIYYLDQHVFNEMLEAN